MIELDQPIVVEKAWEMNDEDDDTDCEEVTPVMGEHSKGSDILSLLDHLWLTKMMLVKNLLMV